VPHKRAAISPHEETYERVLNNNARTALPLYSASYPWEKGKYCRKPREISGKNKWGDSYLRAIKAAREGE
jgi:hypothetical protein